MPILAPFGVLPLLPRLRHNAARRRRGELPRTCGLSSLDRRRHPVGTSSVHRDPNICIFDDRPRADNPRSLIRVGVGSSLIRAVGLISSVSIQYCSTALKQTATSGRLVTNYDGQASRSSGHPRPRRCVFPPGPDIFLVLRNLLLRVKQLDASLGTPTFVRW